MHPANYLDNRQSPVHIGYLARFLQMDLRYPSLIFSFHPILPSMLAPLILSHFLLSLSTRMFCMSSSIRPHLGKDCSTNIVHEFSCTLPTSPCVQPSHARAFPSRFSLVLQRVPLIA